MAKLVQLILVMMLASQCQSFCGEDNDRTKVPIVTVANSTHLRVSWHGLFTGCQPHEVKNMDAVVEHIAAQNTDTEKAISVDFKEKEGALELDPCLQYKIYLRPFSHSGSYKTSEVVKYNDNATLNVASLYGGLLEDEQFMQDVCLKEEGVIRIPDPPEGVSKCILTKGDQENDEFTAPGESHFISLKIRHPTNEERLTITAKVNGIEVCPPTTTPNTTIPITTPPSDASPKLGGVQSAIIFTVSILGTNLAVALIATTVCWLKKRKRRAAVAQVQLDVNPMYGTVYYHLDR